MAMDETLAVKIDEDIERRVEDVAHFFRGEGTLRQNLAEIFFGKFHDRIDERHILQAAAAGVKNGQQVRMIEMRGALPEAELHLGSGRSGGNQFEDRFLTRRIREFR